MGQRDDEIVNREKLRLVGIGDTPNYRLEHVPDRGPDMARTERNPEPDVNDVKTLWGTFTTKDVPGLDAPQAIPSDRVYRFGIDDNGVPHVAVICDEPSPDVHVFETGAIRSKDADDTRYDLISPIALEAWARTCAEGAAKYDDFNWEKGMDVPTLANHAIRHIYLFLSGDRTEDHLGHAIWNVGGMIHSNALWPKLNAGRLRGPGCTPPEASE